MSCILSIRVVDSRCYLAYLFSRPVDVIYWHVDCICFFVQAEDGIRDLVRSRGLGDVYKRQTQAPTDNPLIIPEDAHIPLPGAAWVSPTVAPDYSLSLIHI